MMRLCNYTLLVCALVVCLAMKRDKTITIFTIGDSTMADKSLKDNNQERGWGMMLQGCFSDEVVVRNFALNGRSSKSFIEEGVWQKVLNSIKKGDYLVIQFGHNDEKQDEKRHTDAGTTFDDNLRKFVLEARQRGAIPILMNSVVRRNYRIENTAVEDDDIRGTSLKSYTECDTLVDTHGAYLLSPKNVAKELCVPFVDANKITHDLETSLGKEASRHLHMVFLPGEIASLPKGREDNTHYNVHGATTVANLLAEAIAGQAKELKPYLRHFDIVVSATGRGRFFTLEEALEAAPTGKKTTICLLDGDYKKMSLPKGKHIKVVVGRNATYR